MARLEVDHVPLDLALLDQHVLHEGGVAAVIQTPHVTPPPVKPLVRPGRCCSRCLKRDGGMRLHLALQVGRESTVTVVVENVHGWLDESEALGWLCVLGKIDIHQ